MRENSINKPVRDNARKGAFKKRTQRKSKVMGKAALTKRDKTSGEFMAVKKSAKKFKWGGRNRHVEHLGTVGLDAHEDGRLISPNDPCHAELDNDVVLGPLGAD